MVSEELVLSGVLSVSLLVFFAKILAGVFSRLGLPAILGELFAGIIFGPYALGSLIHIAGHNLIEINEIVLVFSQIGAILILFAAGLEMTFSEFRAAGPRSFIVGGLGVVVPFFSGYYLTLSLGYSFAPALIVGAALTATSIAITVKVLEELGKLNDTDAKVMINAAVVDDVLGLAVLSVVVSVIERGVIPDISEVAVKLVTILALWFALLIGVVFTVPRFLRLLPRWRVEGTEEAAATVTCFGSASLAVVLGLSPIVGAYAAGMALAGSHALTAIRKYVEKINLIFAPIFFAVIGASLNLGSITSPVLVLLGMLLVIAVLSKLVGCGLPAAVLAKSRKSGWKIGLGMTSRGEVGLVIAGLGLTSGVIGQDIYAALIGTVILTTILSPILLKSAYKSAVH
ncbi:MAG: cation:proton antiporter [Thaumarchaeota archaeon]|nr:cation:proton antiporter [Nitrososphaerota archaeon]MCL5317787.1 cation:proton antiporter [Nitrososphaerota archaeon]